MKPPKVYTTGQVAKICQVAQRTVSKWFDASRLHGYKVPGSQDRRIPRESLIKFLKENGMPLCGLEHAGTFRVLLVGVGADLAVPLHERLPARNGFRLHSAATGFEAGIAAANGFDAAVVDLAMGRSEGVMIARQARRLPGTEAAPLVAVACEDDADADALRDDGSFDHVFRRPFDVARLADLLRTLRTDD